MKLIPAKLVAAACLLSMTAATVSAQVTEKVLSDQMLPEKTYLYMSMPNVTAMKSAFSGSSTGQLWSDPSLDDFKQEVLESFGSNIDEAFADVERTLGVSVQELMEIPSGEVSFSLSAAGRSSMGLTLFLDYGDHGSQVDLMLRRASEELDKSGKMERNDEEYDGTEIVSYKLPADQKPPTPVEITLSWMQKDGMLVVSSSPTLLKEILDNWGGSRTDSLLTNEKYAFVLEKCQSGERTSLFTTYFDPIGIFDRVVSTGAAGPASLQVSMAAGVIPTLGLNQFKAMGGCMEMNVGDFEVVSKSVVYADSPPIGIMRVFQGAPTSTTPPTWVKSNVSSWAAMNWKIAEAYDAVEQLVDGFMGPGNLAKMVDELADREPNIHIKNDLIDILTGQIQLVTSTSPEGTFGGDRMLFALGVRDEQAAKDLLARVTKDSGFPGETREFRGATMYEIANPGSDQSIAFTAANGYIYFCVGSQLLEQVLRNDDDVRPLAESEEFTRLAAHFGSDPVAVTFSRPSDQVRTIYEGLRSGSIQDSLPGSADFLSQIDFGTLPPFETLAKYFTPSGGYTIGIENGVYSESFSLKP